MIYNQFETAFSAPRLDKYKIACNNNLAKSLQLYRANIRVSQELYAIIGIFEIVLRNSINRHFVATKGPEWLAESVEEPHGYLNTPGCEGSYHSIQEAIDKLGLMYTHDALVASLTFGFWRHQFNKKEYAASGNTLLSIFVNRLKE